MRLRYYQDEAIVALYNYFLHKTGNPVVAMPTGTGKSVVIAEFIRSVFHYYPGQRVMMLTHVKELIEQNFKHMLRNWPTAPAGIYSAGLGRREHAFPITFAGIASVDDKAALFGRVDLVLVDECHLLSPKDGTMYQSFIGALAKVNPTLKVIGLSATPYRLGQGLITDGGLFTDVCYDITGLNAFNRLIADGYLAPLVTKKTVHEFDIGDVRIVGGEFVQNQLQAKVDRDEITKAAIAEAIAYGHNRKHWLVFATGIEHAKHVATILHQNGIPCGAVHSKTTDAERDQMIKDFKEGRLRALVNNNVLTTGFDFPGIDFIVMLRPTASPGLWVQMLGRGTRPAPGKDNCLVLDFAGNTRRLGPINDPVIPRKKNAEGGGTAPVKLCEACGTYNHASVRFCTCCGAEFPRQVKIEVTASNEELLAGSLPIVETFKVDHVIYNTHTKMANGTVSLKVSYTCGLRMFNEWVCFEHEGYALHKAHDWWRERSLEPDDVPETVAEARTRINTLRTPTHVKVWVNKKQPQVMGYVFENGPEVEDSVSD